MVSGLIACTNASELIDMLGDSLISAKESKNMRTIVEDVRAWIFDAFRQSFTDGGNTLAHGQQDDTFSCGVCTVNTIEHAIFGVALFTHRKRHLLRVRCFNRLVMAHNDTVSIMQA